MGRKTSHMCSGKVSRTSRCFGSKETSPPQRAEYAEPPAGDNAGFLQLAQAFIVLGRHDENAGGDDGDNQHGKVQRAELAHALIAGF